MRRNAATLVLLVLLLAAACSDSGGDRADDGSAQASTSTTDAVVEAGDDRLVGVDPPEGCHPMQGGWLMCGSQQDHTGDDMTRGGLCTDGRLDDELRLVPEVVFSEAAACPTYLEAPPGVSIVFSNGGDAPYEVVIDGTDLRSGSIAPGGDWVAVIDEAGQYPWHSDANEAITGLLEIKPLDEPPPVSTIPPEAA